MPTHFSRTIFLSLYLGISGNSWGLDAKNQPAYVSNPSLFTQFINDFFDDEQQDDDEGDILNIIDPFYQKITNMFDEPIEEQPAGSQNHANF